MPDEAIKRRIFNYQTQLAAFRLLIHMKRNRLLYAAQWAHIHQSTLWTRRLEQHVAKLDQAKRDILIVAITGIASIGATAIVAVQLARAGGFIYRTARMGALANKLREVATVTGQTVRVVSVPSFSLRAWAIAKLYSLPMTALGMGATAVATGGSSFGLVARFYHSASATPLSKEELAQLREMLLAEGIGDETFQAIVRDPSIAEPLFRKALQRVINEKVAQHMSEWMQFLPEPLPGYLLMNDAELARWYRQFRKDAKRIYDEVDLDCSDDERVILRQTELMDFWRQVMRALNKMEHDLNRNIQILENAIKKEETNLRFNRLQRGIHRANPDEQRRGR